MAGEKATRYVAEIKVEKVTTTPAPRTDRPEQREIETFRVTVRAGTLEKLKAKLVGHMNLIEDEDIAGREGVRG